MTAKERAKMIRLESENKHLRAELERWASVYNRTLVELVEVKARLDAVKVALFEEPLYE